MGHIYRRSLVDHETTPEYPLEDQGSNDFSSYVRAHFDVHRDIFITINAYCALQLHTRPSNHAS